MAIKCKLIAKGQPGVKGGGKKIAMLLPTFSGHFTRVK